MPANVGCEYLSSPLASNADELNDDPSLKPAEENHENLNVDNGDSIIADTDERTEKLEKENLAGKTGESITEVIIAPTDDSLQDQLGMESDSKQNDSTNTIDGAVNVTTVANEKSDDNGNVPCDAGDENGLDRDVVFIENPVKPFVEVVDLVDDLMNIDAPESEVPAIETR
jgi:hypothetical protein